MLLELSINNFFKNQEKCTMVSTESSTTVFNIDDNHKCFLSSKSSMISEGSCDIENWSNDAENFALIKNI